MGSSNLHERFPWYAVVEGRELEQGDIVPQCPVVRIVPNAEPAPEPTGELDAEMGQSTGIILTQSCDLAIREGKGRHARDVVFCAVYSRPELANDPRFGSRERWEDARKGKLPAYHVLNHCELPGNQRDFMLVDFTRIFTVPAGVLDSMVANAGPRLRLNPPYREHLAQAFARFFMRVGLPVDIPSFR